MQKTHWLDEFKSFLARGNVVDLAVGVIIGASFNGIVTSLVNDIIMPPIGMAMGGLDFSNFFLVLKPYGEHFASVKAAKDAGAVTVNYGLFGNTIINFLIQAAAIFVVVKQIGKLRERYNARHKEPTAPTPTEALLAEIRDLLKNPPSVHPHH